ncbi:MarR family winged helix-turn-helix transcriptional regulator [Actinomadura sp. 21ATH]|uniref:MarR family winged helix-turn-helix transcriptional regulator n=1 Tax=Actinomadura sp. 21ATH TaxID=1735444 RepID=UPI0035BFF070
MDDLFADPRLTAAGLLWEAGAGLSAKVDPLLKEHGLSALDLNALMRLSRSPGRRLRMTDLAAQTGLSTSGVTRLMDRLARNGLADRESSADDRRATYAVLTPAGLERLERVMPGYLAVVDRWITGLLPPDQLDALVAALRTIRDAANPEAVARTPD